MAFNYGCLIFATVIIFKTDCQQQGFLAGSYNPYTANLLQSMASQVPALSQKAAAGSNFPGPQPPQVLLNAFNTAHRPGSALAPNPTLERLMAMYRRQGTGIKPAPVTPVNKPSMPVTPGTKVMVTKWATQLGYKAYYEAHGCVDPTAMLLGEQARFANIAMMMGCNNPLANHVCDIAQVAHTGGQGSNMRTMMDMMMDKSTKLMLEECLTPSTVMNGIGSMMGSKQQKPPTPPGYVAPQGAAGHPKKAVDCSSVSQMIMMSSATEGLLNPETLEQIGTMRNRYFKMTCQENIILGGLPYRLCCPGQGSKHTFSVSFGLLHPAAVNTFLKAPTMEEAMMMRGMGAM